MQQQPAPAPTRVVTGGTIRLTYDRPDGARLEMSLTRGATRTTTLFAVAAPSGQLFAVTARSWANDAEEPMLAREVRTALESLD
ncbi:hypothetical protein ABZS76_32940 [Streptomyces sp. NPDC005562]|uniref:hypothetical protein n=1 Tax=Streptomyces sp. NPDC005562 TaxID=3154890 RepID=UPI0033A9C6AE